MKIHYNKNVNNRGSILIFVVICASFIMILATVILSLTVTNRQMKQVEYSSKDNFYSTEIGLEEIRTGLEEYVAASLTKAYSKVLEQFIGNTEEQKSIIMRNEFLDDLESSLSIMPGYYDLELLRNCLRDITGFSISSGDNRLIRDDNSITLNNVIVGYEDDRAYMTTISTDIVINSSTSSFVLSYLDPAFAEYALVADNMINLSTTGLVSGAKVNGSIYSGNNGIEISNSSLDIGSASHVVSRGDINIRSNSLLKINDYPSIWVKNISLDSDTTEEYELDIRGKCYVADDLSINGNNSKVNIQGEYYGYSYESYSDNALAPSLTAEANSSIVINGNNAGLNFSNMNALMLAGRGFLSPNYSGDFSEVYTGESITVKNMQMAYLIPKDFLWCESNPVTQEEYLNKPAAISEVDYGRVSSFPINLSEYSDGYFNLHYILHGVQYKYYFIKFKSQAKANEYMQKYFEIYRNGSSELLNVDDLIGGNVESIIIDNTINDIFLTAGNIFTYQSSTAGLIENSVSYDGPSLSAMEQLANQLSKRYDSMTRNLQLVTTRPAYDADSVFNSIVDTGKLDIAPYMTSYPVELNDETYYVHIINNPGSNYNISNISSNQRKGIVIARGSICADANFRGLILSGEDIELRASIIVDASKEMVEGILGMGNEDINRYFRDYASISSPNNDDKSLHVGDLIKFENWKKNE